MTAEEYQKKAHSFSDYAKPVFYEETGNQVITNSVDYAYPALALAEEAGEVAGKFAKAIRDDNCSLSTERKIEIKKELGDVMWFVAELATLLGFTLEEVMQGNIDKLESRKQRGVIHGSGDNR